MTDCSEVLVLGAINVDLVISVTRLPGPGETVVGPGVTRHGGGKGANAAVAAARAGSYVRLVGAVGEDDTGASALAELEDEGINTTSVAVLADPTGVALIVVDLSGENQIAVGAGANAALSAAYVRSEIAASIGSAGAVLVSTEIPGDAVDIAMRTAVEAGVPCVLNPAPVIPEVEGLVGMGAVLTPNAGELSELADLLAIHSGATVSARASVLADRNRAPVVVTMGGDGVVIAAPGMKATHHAAPPAEVVDTTGAGDTFNGVLAAQLACGTDLPHAVEAAVRSASKSVERLGARDGMPTLH